MYKEHYQFKTMPFAHKSDLNFIYLGQNYETPLAMLVSGLDKGLYLHAVLGQDGVGTTTFVRYVEKHIQHSCSVGFIDKEVESSSTLLQFAIESFGHKAKIIDVSEMVRQLRIALKVEFEKNNQQPSILIIDNVHQISPEAFQAINLLTTINYNNRKLLQLILVGNNDTQEILRTKMERVDILWHHLNPLTAEETKKYIHHRLKIAGLPDILLFDEQVCSAIYEKSKGIPKSVNSLCHRLLQLSSLQQTDTISSEQIQLFLTDEKPSKNTNLSVPDDGTYIIPGYFKKSWVSGLTLAGIGLAMGFILTTYLTNPKESQPVVSSVKVTNKNEKLVANVVENISRIKAKVTQETEPLNSPVSSMLNDKLQDSDSVPSTHSEKNKPTEKLLAVAKQQFIESKLLTPINNNAYETYTAILSIDANEKHAISGLQRIANRYLVLASNSLSQSNYSRTKTLIARGLKASPKNIQLVKLSKQIDDFELKLQEKNQLVKTLLEQGKQQIATLNLITPEGNNAYQTYLDVFSAKKYSKQAVKGMQEIQYLLSSELQKALTEQQYDSAWILAKQVISAPHKEKYLQDTISIAHQVEKTLNSKITKLLTLATRQIKAEQLIKPIDNNATETYRKILRIDRTNSKANIGLKNIAHQYKLITKYALDNGKNKQALIYANEAVAVFPKNLALLDLQSKISLTISEQSHATGSVNSTNTNPGFKKRLRPFGNF
jgi:type II secretory pathway predicted ATPase ExeA/tetratricopeptide (TPR) repeat protein